MKRLLAILILLSLTSLLFAYTLVQASDLHFISPSLVEDYGYLEDLARVSDGKDLHQTHLIVDCFISDMLALHPDAIVLSGDLTLNGEQQSHLDLIERFQSLKDAGIKVFALTGNHDVKHTAYRFTKDGVEQIEQTGGQFFETNWWNFGYGDALYQDAWTNSYIAELDKDLWLVALDANTGVTGSIRSTTLTWLKEKLQEAQKKGIRVISVSHQNLLVHNERFTYSYVLNNAKDLKKIYKDTGVKLNLSGHLHIQHWVEEDDIVDIAVSALADTPLQYGVLSINGRSYTYETREISDESLKATAREIFDVCTVYKNLLGLSDIPKEEADQMLETATRLNREYFKGAFSPTTKEEMALWEKHPEMWFGPYLFSIYKDSTTDYRYYNGTL